MKDISLRELSIPNMCEPVSSQSQNDVSCTVVIPCYNEHERLVPELFYDFLRSYKGVRLLFVNDGSADQTLSLLEQMRDHLPERIGVLNNQPNRGKAEAVRLGMLMAIEQSNSGYTGFWDADLATPLELIPRLLEKIEEEPKLQMIFGSRVRLMGHAIDRKASRHYAGRVFATVASASLGLPIYDTQCGAKLFRITSDLKEVLATPFNSRWIFDVELIARFLALHKQEHNYPSVSIYEFPLDRWKDVEGSKVSTLDFFKSLFELIQIHNTYSW